MTHPTSTQPADDRALVKSVVVPARRSLRPARAVSVASLAGAAFCLGVAIMHLMPTTDLFNAAAWALFALIPGGTAIAARKVDKRLEAQHRMALPSPDERS